MRADIAPGGVLPDYELPDHENVPRKLSDLQADDPMILTLARGHYCPKEHQQHLDLAANYPKINVAYTRIVTISTDSHHTSQEFRNSTGAQWPFLSDPERVVQKDLDIQEYTDPENDPMIPHTLVLKPGLVVHSIYNGYWFWGRPSFVDLWRDLRAVTRELRPDWDLSTPGLREAWDAGTLSHFHGWARQAAAGTRERIERRTADAPKVAIITGASHGIGAGLAAGFRQAGYAVVGTARSMPPSGDDGYIVVDGDIGKAETAQRVVAQALGRFGRVDTLVNNAGIYIGKPFTEYTLADYAAISAVNLNGFFHITQLAIAQMVDQGSGHVVNISTSLVDQADSSRPSALPALTKGGLVAASRSLAIEYASHGVRVNAVSLGVVRTPEHDAGSYEALGSLHPLGRVGEVRDVLDAILYLERATFVTGETLHVDGGQAAGR